MKIAQREPKKTWCHEHLVWECYWIDGLENPDFANRVLKSCHEPVLSEEKPWCSNHKPEATAGE